MLSGARTGLAVDDPDYSDPWVAVQYRFLGKDNGMMLDSYGATEYFDLTWAW
jgi:hypothetical protein